MLPKVAIGTYACAESIYVDNYEPYVGSALVEEVHQLSRALKGLRVCQINATPAGGGVAELLSRQIPMYQALGIQADWRIIHGDTEFFNITKGFHNGLQGATFHISSQFQQKYLRQNQLSAELLETEYDVYIIHDPQPAALRFFKKSAAGKWIWRCHIDSSTPNQDVWQFLKSYIEVYDATIFTLPEFCPPDLRTPRLAIIPPAIDPFSTKNMSLPQDLCRKAVASLGINLEAPLLVQVSRFDPWKDPWGVIKAYRMVKEIHPDVQLALVGTLAGDDPEGWGILEGINQETLKDADLHVYSNLNGVGSMEVNVFQRAADVMIQKSLKEGFGLVVSEAFWKEKPLVAGAVGGIPMQFPSGYTEYLVHNSEECAAKILNLLANPDLAVKFGRAAKLKVQEQFLLPRLMRDELRLLHEVVNQK